jgi:hypothetical protein
VLPGLAEAMVKHFNGRLSHNQKKELGLLNSKVYAIRNKTNSHYLGGKRGNSPRNQNIYEAKLWRSLTPVRRRLRYSQDLEVVEVQLTSGKVISV